MVRRFVSFAAVGTIATTVQFAGLAVLVEYTSMYPVVASAASFCVSACLNYTLNYIFTFRSSIRHSTAFVRFVIVAAVGLVLNAGAFWLLFEGFGIHYFFAQCGSTGATLVWTYTAHATWTYTSPKNGGAEQCT